MLSFRSMSIHKAMLIAGLVVTSGTGFADDRTQIRQGATVAAQMQVNAQVMAGYKKSSWDQYQSLVASGQTAAASDVPPTDCPPAPTQVCTDSWKPTIINPFPGKSIKTVNPFE